MIHGHNNVKTEAEGHSVLPLLNAVFSRPSEKSVGVIHEITAFVTCSETVIAVEMAEREQKVTDENPFLVELQIPQLFLLCGHSEYIFSSVKRSERHLSEIEVIIKWRH